MNKEKVRTDLSLSKELSYLLRHCPESKHLTMDKHGWVKISELITNAPEFTMENIKTIVETDSKTRYSISDDGEYIRANQGHSIKVNIDFKPYTGTKYLYHGTSKEALNLIQSSGAILPMSRQFVHLSKDKETAKKVGKRHSHNDMPVIIVIDTKKMLEDGRQLFESENGVVLAERVDIKYFVRVE